jgi:hypothetical protein
VEVVFACVRGGVLAAAAYESVSDDDVPATNGMYQGALRVLTELLGKGCVPPSCAPLLGVAAGALRECCGAFASAAAAAEEGGWGGDSPALEDAAVAFLRAVAVVLSAQLPRLGGAVQVESS